VGTTQEWRGPALHRRLGAAGLMFGSAATAFACIEACMTKFGEVVWDGGDTYYEFEYCTERFNDRGGISTTCFYSEHEI